MKDYALELVTRAESGDSAVLDRLAEAGTRIAQLCEILGSVLSPDLFVLGGEGAVLAPWLLPESSRFDSRGLETPVVRGTLDGAAAITGALVAARDAVIEAPPMARLSA
jgi:predicted NBD/HSP70 family sugar kinase